MKKRRPRAPYDTFNGEALRTTHKAAVREAQLKTLQERLRPIADRIRTGTVLRCKTVGGKTIDLPPEQGPLLAYLRRLEGLEIRSPDRLSLPFHTYVIAYMVVYFDMQPELIAQLLGISKEIRMRFRYVLVFPREIFEATIVLKQMEDLYRERRPQCDPLK